MKHSKLLKDGEVVRAGKCARGGIKMIKPVMKAVWLALYGKKIGRIEPEEIEEESAHEQEKLSER